jgi:hypothetical protein
LRKPGRFGDVILEDLDREERDQAHHGADLQGKGAVLRVELVVIETVLLVPETHSAERVHRVHDRDEMFEKLRRDVLVGRVLARQLERHRQHRGAEEGHPGRPVGLLQVPARRQLGRPVEDADVVEPKEPAREEVLPFRVLAVDPPGEVDQEFLEDPRQEDPVAVPSSSR